jgi:coproporphyrinogen III oxidase-like Fe-S oxidoreductase
VLRVTSIITTSEGMVADKRAENPEQRGQFSMRFNSSKAPMHPNFSKAHFKFVKSDCKFCTFTS